MNQETSPLATPDEAAEYLNITKRSVLQMMEDGVLEVVRPSGKPQGHRRVTWESVIKRSLPQS